MRRGVYLAVLGVVVSGAVIVTISVAQVYPVRWYEAQPEPAGATPPSLVLADGDLQFPDGTVQLTAAGSGEPLGLTPSPSLVLADGGIQFSDGTVQDTAAGSLVPKTGEILSRGTGDDGDLQRGAPPNPRFTDKGSGTVTDNLTGLIWLDDANCFGSLPWQDALAKANDLFDGCTDCGGARNDCGLADGSVVGQWRLPNVRELQSLVHYGVAVVVPPVPDTAGTGQWSEGDPFSDVQSAAYWSSSPGLATPLDAWVVVMSQGELSPTPITTSFFVWPVRGGQ